MAEEKEKPKVATEKLTLVVAELPQQPVRDYTSPEDGTEYKLLTIQEAISEILAKVTKIEKAVA